jgi:hypothetical protein
MLEDLHRAWRTLNPTNDPADIAVAIAIVLIGPWLVLLAIDLFLFLEPVR